MDDKAIAVTDPRPAAVETLGMRLTEQAERIVARYEPDFAWARPAVVLLRHIAGLPPPAAHRFARNEAPAPAVQFAVARPALAGPARAAMAAPPARRPAGDAGMEGNPLPPDVRERLRPIAGLAAEAIRVHQGEAADEVARSHRADAVTVGQDVFFREGRFRPREPRGFGLLAHEATHVAQLMQAGAAWRRATGGGLEDEEANALKQERRARSAASSVPSSRPAGPGVPADRLVFNRPAGGKAPVARRLATAAPPVSPTASAPAAAAQPMRAESDRDAEPPIPPPPGFDLEELRRTLTRDLMRQLRAEFERGG